jgi:hypothetical protein
MRGSFFTLRNFTYPQLNWGLIMPIRRQKIPEKGTIVPFPGKKGGHLSKRKA